MPTLLLPQADLPPGSDLAAAAAFIRFDNLPAALALSRTAGRGAVTDDARWQNLLGVVRWKLEQIEQSAACFARAAELAPARSAYAFNEGCTLLRLERLPEAASAFQRSLDGDELLYEAHVLAWTVFNSTGRLEPFTQRLKRALRAELKARGREPPRANRVELPGVTLVGVDCQDPDLAARALWKSLAHCRFAQVKLLTSAAVQFEDITTVPIAPLNTPEEYSRFLMKELPRHVTTEHVLVTRWSGYVRDAAMWSSEFLSYDYIGAPWTAADVHDVEIEKNVGNGSFSLRSRRYLDAGCDERYTQTHPEDMHLCRTYRDDLEQRHGVRFAPVAVAERFSTEHAGFDKETFGFHGVPYISLFEPDPKWMRFEFLDEEAE